MPSYPNWQRKRIQNPCSVSSSLTEGTSKARSERALKEARPPIRNSSPPVSRLPAVIVPDLARRLSAYSLASVLETWRHGTSTQA